MSPARPARAGRTPAVGQSSGKAAGEFGPAVPAGDEASVAGGRPVGGDGTSGVDSWAPSPRPLRADARRNREAVLAAAAAAFSAEGVEAPLEDIARKAGVGVGTLYRHFPTREALVFGVYAREVEHLAASGPQLAADLEPAVALREWMRRFVHYAATKRGLIGMLRTMMADDTDLFEQTKAQIRVAADDLLKNASAAGQIRDDITAEDLVRSMGGICMAGGPGAQPECAGRLVDLVFDGLRYGAPAAG
jgi:AcrR family transcriptional regulator